MFLSSDGFLRISRPKEQATVRLVCFPPAGADAFIWDAYAAFLPESIELCAIQLPDRGKEAEAIQYKEIAEIIAALAGSLQQHARPGQKLVFHGYCVGAFWAYELARYMRDRVGVQPAHFIIAGCMAPHQRSVMTAFMRTKTFVEIMTTYYPPHTPQHVYVLSTVPAMMHDADVLDQDTPPLEKPFDFPLTVFGSHKDQFVPNSEDLRAWQAYTTGEFSIQFFEGDHFFGVSNPEGLVQAMVERIQAEPVQVGRKQL